MQSKIDDINAAENASTQPAEPATPKVAPEPAEQPKIAPDPAAEPLEASADEDAEGPAAEADAPESDDGAPVGDDEVEAIFDELEDSAPEDVYAKLEADYEALQAEYDALAAEHATLSKRYDTFQADWENYRRRTEENLVLEKANASKKLVTAILPPLDDFERAITHAQQIGADPDVVSGMYAIYKKMISILNKEGVEQVRGKGEKFDIETQQAIERREGTDMEPDMVAEVYQTGYIMNGVVIRPALVAVTA